ncbi:amidohydrolase [Candidatus Entotheonella serta]|nr:amidohydrolase [Candidatus Entotheonella serta]
MSDLQLISADSHMVEPPDLWSTRLDKAFRDRVPGFVMDPKGKKGLYFVCDGLEPRLMSSAFASGVSPEELLKYHQETTLENGRAGGWDPVARLEDMALDGVRAEVLYTSVGFGLLGLLDEPYQVALFRAYNDWLAEFCRHDSKRFAGLAMIPLLDVATGVQELKRSAKMGLKGALIMASPPPGHSFISREYDPFWAEAEALNMPVSLHASAGHGPESKDKSRSRYQIKMCNPHEIQRSFIDIIFSGVLERYPGLKLVSAENDIGWIPHFLYSADYYFNKYRHYEPTELTMPPSAYWNRQVYATFMNDAIGIEMAHHVGEATYMWASDYPHTQSTWPHSRDIVEETFTTVSDAVRQKIICDNVAKLYDFDLDTVMAM